MGLLFVMVAGGCTVPAGASTAAADHSAEPSAAVPSPSVAESTAAAVTYPARGGAEWTTAPGEDGPGAGDSGTLLRYRVVVERDITGISAEEFAGAVTATLSDPRGWTAGGTWRLRRVGPGEPYGFTIHLATPGTRDELCHDGPDRYTSCRYEDSVVVNVARWFHGVPHFDGDLATYRQYVVNHEVGHRLGHGHELCPGDGELGPVMLQQTLNLHGCTPNPWPYVDGKRYAGKSGSYNDPQPAGERGQSA